VCIEVSSSEVSFPSVPSNDMRCSLCTAVTRRFQFMLNRFRSRRQMWHVNKPLARHRRKTERLEHKIRSKSHHSSYGLQRCSGHKNHCARLSLYCAYDPTNLTERCPATGASRKVFSLQRQHRLNKNLETFAAHRASRDIEPPVSV